ncbi:MAG: sugar phosphate isomerase/epimerase family protein [Candidatus Latescibacterota bacterium]
MRTKLKRRSFILAAGMAAAASQLHAAEKTPEKGRDASKDMPLGIIMGADEPEKSLPRVKELGFSTCQLSVGEYSSKLALRVKETLAKYSLKPTSLICMGPGNYAWNFYEGPTTIGLVPREMRAERIARLKKGADFCHEAGIPAVHAHFGFIPENPNDVLYKEFIVAMKEVARYMKDRGLSAYFETGQETPVTLLRAIEDIGTGNLGVNYDTANLILYGKANPVDGLDVIGKYVRSLHAKDGFYPTDPRELGKEVPIGEGKVNFPLVIRKLKELNFKGHITIEREISGARQEADILKSKKYLENLIRTV